ncbi:MAG: hypothetical protein AB7R89_32725 [Dehalococcoidia bacterium]
MRPRHSLPILAAVIAFCAFTFFSTMVKAQTGSEHVQLSPPTGTLATHFVFSGSGFTPGLTVSIRFYPPDAVERRIRTEHGVEVVWPVQPDGTFSLDFVPAQQFPNASPGRWQALFCAFRDRTCQMIEFDVLP